MSTEPETEKAASQSHACPQCGGQMKFDAAHGALACPFCGHVMHTSETTETVEEHDLMAALRDTKSKAKGFGVQMKSLKCQSCGATNNVEPNVTSTHCPFCGSNQVVEQQPDPNMIRPESVIPFKVDDGRANSLFIKWLGSGLFHPGDLKRYGGAQKLDGIYLPFWTFDAEAYSRWRAESGDYYYESHTVTVTRDGKQVQETQQVQKIRWYPSSGQRRGTYDDVLVYATESIDVKMINKIYPYNTQELVPYNPSYLSGWAAEAYSIELERAWQLGKDIIQSKEYDECRRDVPGDTHRNLRVNTALSNLTYKHVMLPVWLASYRYNEKVYRFMINGQTGEVQGQKPISWIKVAIAVVIAIAIIVVVVLLVRAGRSDTGSGLLMYEYALATLGIL